MSQEQDPVAPKSGFLCSYMNAHKDTLHAYVLAHTDTHEASDCKMDSIDANGFSLSYVAASKANPKLTRQTVHIPFKPRIKLYDELRPRMLEMKREAEAASGMKACPVIDASPVWNRHVFFGSFVVGFLALASTLTLLPASYLRISWYIVLGIHSIEASFLFTRLRKYKVPFPTNLVWILYNLIAGFPVLLQFKNRVQSARIASATPRKQQ